MDKQAHVETGPGQSSDIQQQVQQVRELFANAPEVGKTALEKVLREIESGAPPSHPATRLGSAGRVGSRQGTVSELTLIVPHAPGGAERLRAILKLTHGNADATELVGTVHDMRFAFLEDELQARAFDFDL